MKVINFIAGPSSGKSTLAYKLSGLMKENHYNMEYVHEYAKELTWDERFNCLRDQLSILGHQNNMMHRLRGKVDWVVTDTCLVLGLIYSPDDYFKSFEPLLLDVFNSYDNVNIFVDRPSTYSEIGRNQKREEAIGIDKKALEILEKYKLPYIRVNYNIAPEDLLMIIANNEGFSSK